MHVCSYGTRRRLPLHGAHTNMYPRWPPSRTRTKTSSTPASPQLQAISDATRPGTPFTSPCARRPEAHATPPTSGDLGMSALETIVIPPGHVLLGAGFSTLDARLGRGLLRLRLRRLLLILLRLRLLRLHLLLHRSDQFLCPRACCKRSTSASSSAWLLSSPASPPASPPALMYYRPTKRVGSLLQQGFQRSCIIVVL